MQKKPYTFEDFRVELGDIEHDNVVNYDDVLRMLAALEKDNGKEPK